MPDLWLALLLPPASAFSSNSSLENVFKKSHKPSRKHIEGFIKMLLLLMMTERIKDFISNALLLAVRFEK